MLLHFFFFLQQSSFVQPYPLSQVDALLKKHLRTAMFQQTDTGTFSVEVAPLVLHGGRFCLFVCLIDVLVYLLVVIC
jgi:hypothetical protein